MKKVSIVSSWDDGHPLDLKLSKILEKNEIPATFYIPIRNSEGKKVLDGQQIKDISELFDVGGHTYNHLDLTAMPIEEARKEITKGKEILEGIIERDVESFCYPRGLYNADIIRIVRESGFSNARTVRLLENGLKDPYQMGTTVHVTEKGLTHFTNYMIKSDHMPNKRMVVKFLSRNMVLKDWHHLANIALDYMIDKGGIFHIWGHSWEIEQFGQWDKLSAFLERVKTLKESDVVSVKNISDLQN